MSCELCTDQNHESVVKNHHKRESANQYGAGSKKHNKEQCSISHDDFPKNGSLAKSEAISKQNNDTRAREHTEATSKHHFVTCSKEHPDEGSKQHSESCSKKHINADCRQHSESGSKKHTNADCRQHSESGAKKHTNADCRQHSESGSKKHTNADCRQHSESGSKKHTSADSRHHLAPGCKNHTEPEARQHMETSIKHQDNQNVDSRDQSPSRRKKAVMIAMDGSGHSFYAFDWYMSQMHTPETEVIVAHSSAHQNKSLSHVQSLMPSVITSDPSTMSRIIQQEEEEVNKIVAQIKGKLTQAGVRGKLLRLTGEPGAAIIQAAQDHMVHCIVTGSRGLGTVRRTLIGSVSDYILHHAHCPVLVCRHKET